MKIKIVEGTPEEIAEYEASAKWWEDNPRGDDVLGEEENVGDDISDFDGGLTAFIAARATPQRARLLYQMCDKLNSDDTVVLEIGTSKNSPDGLAPYFMVKPQAVGWVSTAAYIRPSSGKVDIRLNKDTIDRLPKQADWRDVKDSDPYQVAVRINSEADVNAAVDLIRRAATLQLQQQ